MKDPILEANRVLSEKLNRLLSFLHRSGKSLENAVQKATSKNIKKALGGVLLETNQYKREVDAQIQCLVTESIKPVAIQDDKRTLRRPRGSIHRNKGAVTDEQIMDQCCNEEINLEKEYRDILNEFFPYHGLRDMLRHQLSGFKCAFMQLKLLRSVM
jgi:hypothetical protein